MPTCQLQQTLQRHENVMKNIWRVILTIALSALVWLAWQSPMPAPGPASTQTELPPNPEANKTSNTNNHKTGLTGQLWRVITRRVLSDEGIRALKYRLKNIGLKPITLLNTEEVTMHAFDDAMLFKSKKKASAIARFWQQHHVETTVIKAAPGVYLLGLGRLYQAKYAEVMQKELDKVGRKYRYQQRIVPIPVRRFTFAPRDKQSATVLWKKLDVTGVMMPVLMPETQFQKLYGNSLSQRRREHQDRQSMGF